MTEVLDDPLAQEKVLVPAAGQGARRAFDDTSLGDGLAPLELLVRQIEFDTAGQPVPPVEAVLVAIKMHFAQHKITSEDVIDDQGGDVTLAPGRVAGLPVGLVVGRASIGSPAGSQGIVEVEQVPSRHAGSIAATTDISGATAHSPNAHTPPSEGRIVVPDREINCPRTRTSAVRSPDLSTLTQEVLDLWLTTHPTRPQGVGSFVRWTLARSLTSGIKLPPEVTTDASGFLTEDEHYGQLRRCLNDDQLPLDVRIIGAMVRLYGVQVTRIVTLTTDRFHKEETDWYVTFDRNPVLLPPKLGRLIEEQIRHPARVSMLEQLPGDGPRYLWPGRPASRPIGGGWAHTRLKRHGLPNLSARNTAMIEFVTELSPIVVSDLLGTSSTVPISPGRGVLPRTSVTADLRTSGSDRNQP